MKILRSKCDHVIGFDWCGEILGERWGWVSKIGVNCLNCLDTLTNNYWKIVNQDFECVDYFDTLEAALRVLVPRRNQHSKFQGRESSRLPTTSPLDINIT